MRTLVPLLCVASLAVSGCRKAPAPGNTAPAPTATTPAPNTAAPEIKPMPAEIPAVLARVNGEAIEKWEFEGAVKRMEARAGGPVPADKRDMVLRNVLDQLVAYHLLAQEARARKFNIDAAIVDGEVAQIRASYPNDEAFQKALDEQGITVDRLRQQTRMNLEVQKMIESEVASKIAVQDGEVSAFYQQNLERFKQGDAVHASHILIGASDSATPAEKAQAKTKAQAVLKKVRAGGDFAAIARAESNDPGSAPNGGDLGFFPRGQMTPAFEEAAFATKPGAVSNLIETPFGYHIIKVHERRPPRTAPLSEVGGQIKNFLEQGQRQQKLEQLVGQMKTRSKIEILV